MMSVRFVGCVICQMGLLYCSKVKDPLGSGGKGTAEKVRSVGTSHT